jgi:membrane associated rhomboid family serine protease
LSDDAVDALVEIRSFASLQEAGDNSLVLVAAGIDCHLARRGGLVSLLVAASRQDEARAELDAYAEDSGRGPRPEQLQFPARDGLTGVLAYFCAMIALYSATTHQAFGFDWFTVGEGQAGLIGKGEWWRTLTALGLHADLGHLIGNLIAGGLFGFFLSETVGAGVAWLTILLAGIAGNAVNALLQPASHTSIGASTAIFGAIGLLAVLALKHQRSRWRGGLRRWAPIGAGLMLLAFIGIEGERIDIGAHIAGFGAGCLIGAGLLMSRTLPNQALSGTAAVVLFCAAWAIGLLAA